MNVFDKRPLSLILCILLGSFAFFTFGDTLVRAAVILTAIFAFLFAMFFAKERRKKIIVIICTVAMLLSSLFSFLYFDLYFKAYKRFEGDVCVTGKITSYSSSPSGIDLTVKTKDVNGKPFSKYKLKVYLNYGEATDISVGNTVIITGAIEPFGEGSGKDAFNYNYSTGISGKIDDVKSIISLENGNPGLSYHLSSYRDAISRRIILASDQTSGGLMAAFLIGDRAYLSDNVATAFTRLGITHILALSGMHLVLLIGGFEKLLAIFGVHKKLRKILGILLCTFYVILTGFPASVLRAGIMLIITSTLFLISERSDSITSLFISAFLIILVTPYAVYDVSLCLSVLATFGIIPFVEKNINKSSSGFKGKIKEMLKTLLVSMILSVFAIGTTLIITTFQFNTLSLAGIIATLIFSVIPDPFLYLGVLTAIFGNFGPFGFITKICLILFSPFRPFILQFQRLQCNINIFYPVHIYNIYPFKRAISGV
jgi:ComEC/Rec2-related protein